MQISINCSAVTGKLAPFWQSTGFTPATLLLTADMRQQIIYWGSIPRKGLLHARIHYLLELVDVRFGADGSTSYDWSRLDRGLDLLVQNGMIPMFEIMGNPNGQFSDFNDDLQRWKNLVRDLAKHLMERYGQNEVERWYFETWNEPDGGFGWSHQWPQDEVSFCNYYDACVAGLNEANPRLTIGGPGTCQGLSGILKAFLAHCDSGTNYFTGAKGTRLDFLSVHEKGAKPHKEDLNPRTAIIIERERQILEYVRAHHPRLAGLPFMNNECDPQVGWKDHHTWHARPHYAAWMCKSTRQHLERLADGMGVNYAILSNDNGFIGAWGHRTLLARFGAGEWIHDGQGGHAARQGWAVHDFPTPDFSMIKKPAFSALTLLSLLGDERLAWQAEGALAQPAADADLGVIATRVSQGPGCIAVLVYYSRDTILSSGSEKVQVRLEHLPFQKGMVAHYRIDEAHSDPYTLWEAAGAPDKPNDVLLDAMRQAQELALLQEPVAMEPVNGAIELPFDLPLHAVSLIMVMERPEDGPSPVIGLRAETFAGLNGGSDFLLRWEPLPERTVRSYEVLRADTPDGPFRQVNPVELLCSAYLSTAPGYYQVAAVDFWGRKGKASEIILCQSSQL